MSRNRIFRNVALVVLFTLVFSNLLIFAEDLSLFQRLKIKALQKFDQIKNPEWLMTQAGGGAISLAVGKIGGIMGAAVGGLLGLCVGGPAGGAMGMFIGFRVGNVITKTFAKPVAVSYVESKIKKETFSLKEAIAQLDKKQLSIAASGAVIGDLVGGAIGAAAGVALMAGCGPIALPIVGAVAGVVIGQKIGRAIGSWVCKFLVKTAAVAGYRAFAAKVREEPETHPAETLDSSQALLIERRQQYEAAYRQYVAAQTNANLSAAEKQRLLQAYQSAASNLQAVEATR
jgi:outer membrane lipoprotein SlyB